MLKKMTIMPRLIITIVASIVFASGILTYVNLKRQKEQMIEEVKVQARMAADQLIAVRKVIAKKQQLINSDSKGNTEYKGVIPAVVGREVATEFSQNTIFKMKQTSLQFRNPANKPDNWEIQQLERFEVNDNLKDLSGITTLGDGTEVFRLMVPLKITEACLKCHGDPMTSPTGDGKDIAGWQMEHYKLGEIRGGISVIAPMSNVEAAFAANKNFNIMANGIYVLFISGVVFFIVRGIVNLLKKIVNNLSNGAGEITSASAEIASSSQSLAEGASHQAASIEQTSASIEEMASMSTKNAEGASEANQLAIKSRESAEKGDSAVKNLQATIEEIHQGNNKVLSIIKSIDEIAFQTNLLALNAAVEAARAGEHGKGFAVVAEEVRSLAQRCSTASKETADLINARVEKNERVSEMANNVAKSLSEIVTETKKVTDLAGEITAGSQEQSEGVVQIGKAVTTIDTVTQQNAANAEEMASASQELSAQAENLKAIVAELAAQVGESSGDSFTVSKSRSPRGRTISHTPRLQSQNRLRDNASSKYKSDGNGADAQEPSEFIPMDDDF